MKTLPTILLLILSIDLFGQIDSRKDWPKSIQREFDLIKKQDIDTFLIYYSWLGPWTNLPDSCEGISSVWILWNKNKKSYAQEIFCDSSNRRMKQIQGKSFSYFLSHRKDFQLKEEYYNKKSNIILSSTDRLEENLIFMTKKENIVLKLTEDQRTDERWKSLVWIKAITEAIDITKLELEIS